MTRKEAARVINKMNNQWNEQSNKRSAIKGRKWGQEQKGTGIIRAQSQLGIL
jgi:hypothetical protein